MDGKVEFNKIALSEARQKQIAQDCLKYFLGLSSNLKGDSSYEYFKPGKLRAVVANPEVFLGTLSRVELLLNNNLISDLALKQRLESFKKNVLADMVVKGPMSERVGSEKGKNILPQFFRELNDLVNLLTEYLKIDYGS